MKLSFTKKEHEEFIKNHFQIKTAHVIDEENEMYYILPVKEDYTKHDRVIAKTQAEKFGFVFGDGLMVVDYKPIKPTCANYERDNVLLSEMEQNIKDYIAKKYWTNEFLEKQYKPCEDSIVESVRQKLLDRSNVGIKKYNTTLETNNTDNYLKHAQEEAMDLSNYLEKLMQQKEDITQIVAKYPNNMELGSEIRKIYGK
jgi:hypothetical protein